MFKKKSLIFALIIVSVFTFSFAAAAQDELVLWHTSFTSEWSGLDDTVEFFEENTELNVSTDYGPPLYRDISQQLIVQARTGNPDVVEGVLEQMFTYAKADLIMPLNDFWEDYEDKDQYLENVMDAVTLDGEIYAIPYNTNVRLLLYRKSIFEEHDLEVPTNWDELVETATYISENVDGMDGFMFTTKEREVRAFQEFMSFYLQLNKSMFDVSGENVELTATVDQLEQVLGLYDEMFASGAISSDNKGADWKALDYGYTSGNQAMVTVGPWIWSHRDEDEGRAEVIDDTGIAAIPVAENGTPGTYMEVKPIMINKYTENPEQAWELAKEVTSKDFQLLVDSKAGVLSPRKDVMAEPEMSDNWWLQGFSEYADTGVALDPISWERPQNAIISAIQEVIYNEGSPAEIAEELHQELSEIAANL
jgi:ABC-type glycerol-3-phosphate transport system substrate-binding protein